MKKMIVLLMCCLVLGGCGNSGVSQAQYESVVAERDELKNQVESLSEKTVNSDQNDKQETEKTKVESSKSDETVESKSEAIEVLAEYTLSDSIGWYTRHFIIVKNNSNETVDISTSSLAYSDDGTMVGAANASFDALGAGCTSVMYEAFDVEAEVNYYETEISSSSGGYYESVIQDLSFVQNDIDGGAVFQVTNNGADAAQFVEGYALFFMGDKLAGYESTYFTDDDSQIKPGKTISKQMKSFEDFDRIEFYLTGRK